MCASSRCWSGPMLRWRSLNLRFPTWLVLLLLAIPVFPARAQPFAENVAKAEEYLVKHFNPSIGLIYESEDLGKHWLSLEQIGYHWRYNQTYWLYSDNLFAYLALRRDFPQISRRIQDAVSSYRQPPSELFEVLTGERIKLPLHNAQDLIVARDQDHVIMIRRHNATSIAMGVYVDFWMYLALEHALEGDLLGAGSLVRQAEWLWRGNGLWDWSFTIFDHMFSNQKLALLIFTARAIGVNLEHEAEMEAHLWSMQNSDGGVAALSYPTGKKAGSANVETTALAILMYDQSLLSRFPKVQQSKASQAELLPFPILVGLAVLLTVTILLRKRVLRPSSINASSVGSQ
jgi:hypothetical protein